MKTLRLSLAKAFFQNCRIHRHEVNSIGPSTAKDGFVPQPNPVPITKDKGSGDILRVDSSRHTPLSVPTETAPHPRV